MPELKFCPFCGGEVSVTMGILSTGDKTGRAYFSAECFLCGTEGTRFFYNNTEMSATVAKTQAANFWNTRYDEEEL